MTEPTVIRFEATDIDPAIFEDDVGFLVMETAKDGRVAIHMQHAVFVDLFERMRIALEQLRNSSPDQSKV